MKSFKKIVRQYRHIWVAAYILIYAPWFAFVEHLVSTNSHYHIIHSPLDDMIPFVPAFIIPYLIWFPFIFGIVAYFFFTDVKEFYRLAFMLMSGMTLFLIISTFFHNGLNIRPTHINDTNIFTHLVLALHRVDTPTNVFPSIHVYNTLAVCIAVWHSKKLANHPVVRGVLYGIGLSIILSTMFLKQHSVIDVMGAIVMTVGFFMLFYLPVLKKEAIAEEKGFTVNV